MESEAKTAGSSTRASKSRLAAVGSIGIFFVLWLLPPALRAVTVAFGLVWALVQLSDRLLGRLACWAISRTPKAFVWTIRAIRVRPSLAFWSPDAWSEITVCDWVWHNPPSFEGDSKAYLLRIERMSFRLELASIYRAMRYNAAIKINLMLVEGLHFWTQRSESGLNLDEALDLPDNDVNVSAIMWHAKQHGGLTASDLATGQHRSMRPSAGGLSASSAGSMARGRSAELPATEPGTPAAQVVPAAAPRPAAQAAEARSLRPRPWRLRHPMGWQWWARLRQVGRGTGGEASGAGRGEGDQGAGVGVGWWARLRGFASRRRGAAAGRGAAGGAPRAAGPGWWARLRGRGAAGGAPGVARPGWWARLRQRRKPAAGQSKMPPWMQGVRPLPPIATLATRKAARYWKPSWGNPARARDFYQRIDQQSGCFCGCVKMCMQMPSMIRRRLVGRVVARDYHESDVDLGEDDASSAASSSPHRPPQDEYPIGDPRRRPRWGVPVRFDIEQIVALRLRLDVLALLTRNPHRTLNEEVFDSSIRVKSLVVSRHSLEAGDARRRGAFGGVRGVFLGELVWVLIAKAVHFVVWKSPSRGIKNAFLAAGYALKDTAVRWGAGALELALNAEHSIAQEMHHLSEAATVFRSGCGDDGDGLKEMECRLRVHLIAGRRITWMGQPTNAHVRLALKRSRAGDGTGNLPGRPSLGPSASGGLDLGNAGGDLVVDRGESAVRVWTASPKWDEYFDLGPVEGASLTLSVTCHHLTDVLMDFDLLDPPAHLGRFIGEILLPLDALLVKDEAIHETGEIVGWFPLLVHTDSADAAAGGNSSSGAAGNGRAQLKLGLQLVQKELRNSQSTSSILSRGRASK